MNSFKKSNSVSSPSLRKFKRQCVACRGYFLKESLVKIVKATSPISTSIESLQVHLNPASSVFGRSIYCCNTEGCLQKLLSKRGKLLNHRLKTSSLLSPLLTQLEQLLLNTSVVPFSSSII